MGKKITVGYGDCSRPKNRKNSYAGRSNGKMVNNGGFNHQPTVDFLNIDEKTWDNIFPNGYKPSWDK